IPTFSQARSRTSALIDTDQLRTLRTPVKVGFKDLQGTLKGWAERAAIVVEGDKKLGERRAEVAQGFGLVLAIAENVRFRMVDRHSFGLPVDFNTKRRGDRNSRVSEILDRQKEWLTRNTGGTDTHTWSIPCSRLCLQILPAVIAKFLSFKRIRRRSGSNPGRT